MKRLEGLLVLGALVAVGCRPGAEASRDEFRSGVVIAARDTGRARMALRDERHLMFYNVQTMRNDIIRERTTTHCCDDFEPGYTRTIELTRLGVDSLGSMAPGWTTEISADGGGLAGDFYRAVVYGCCGAIDQYRFVSLVDGREQFAGSAGEEEETAHPVQITIPNGYQKRFVTFDASVGHGDSVVGILYYGGTTGPVQRARVKAAADDDPTWLLLHLRAEVDDSGGPGREYLNLWSSNGVKTPGGFDKFHILVTLAGMGWDGPGVTLRVPVSKDSLILSRATIPKGYTIERIP